MSNKRTRASDSRPPDCSIDDVQEVEPLSRISGHACSQCHPTPLTEVFLCQHMIDPDGRLLSHFIT